MCLYTKCTLSVWCVQESLVGGCSVKGLWCCEWWKKYCVQDLLWLSDCIAEQFVVHKVGETIARVSRLFQHHKLTFPYVIATKSNCNNNLHKGSFLINDQQIGQLHILTMSQVQGVFIWSTKYQFYTNIWITNEKYFVCYSFSLMLCRIPWRFPEFSVFREIPKCSRFTATAKSLHHWLLTPFDAHCCHISTAIKHPVPDQVKLSFVICDIRALWRSGLSVRVSGYHKLQMTA